MIISAIFSVIINYNYCNFCCLFHFYLPEWTNPSYIPESTEKLKGRFAIFPNLSKRYLVLENLWRIVAITSFNGGTLRHQFDKRVPSFPENLQFLQISAEGIEISFISAQHILKGFLCPKRPKLQLLPKLHTMLHKNWIFIF